MPHQSHNVGRTLHALACLLACTIAGGARIAGAQQPQVFSAAGQADVTSTVAAFKAALGGGDNGAAVGSQPAGYRQVTWDDVPDAQAAPNALPSDFYNTTSPRGLLISGNAQPGGQYENPPVLPVYQVSASPSNPTSTPILFGNLNPAFPSLFTTYSAPRLFRFYNTNLPGSKTSVMLTFRQPGSTEAAVVTGFGAVLTDVNLTGATMEVFDLDRGSIGVFPVPPASGHQTVSFLGLVVPGGHIRAVEIKFGTEPPSAGVVEDATHDVIAIDDLIYGEPQPLPAPAIILTTPTTQSELTANGPFLTIGGRKTNARQITWTNDRGGSGFASGTVGTVWSITDIPIAAGPNVITIQSDPPAPQATTIVRVNRGPFAYSFAEGSTGGFFDTDINIANPNADAAPVTITFLREDGTRIEMRDTIAPIARKAIHVDDVPGMEGTAFSTIVTSENRLPLIVERSMFWDRSYYGGKGATAVTTPSETWLFAEGVQNSFFSTFVLLENPGTDAATATLTFERAFDEPPVIQDVPLPPLSRVTVDTSTIPALAGRSFGLSIQATKPIVAERATYFGTTPTQLWPGGHGSSGATAPAGAWFFAEGATGPFRETFLLLSNPTDTPASPLAEFAGGAFSGFRQSFELPPHSRLTVPLEGLSSLPPTDFPLANGEFAMTVSSVIPIVAERAMYWLGPPGPWADGTSSFGVNSSGLRWGFAEGRAGGPLNYHTYIRIYNPNAWPLTGAAEVKVTFIKSNGSTVVRTYTVQPFKDGEAATTPYAFVTIDANTIPELAEDRFATVIESTNGVPIVTERSMYWDSNGVFWAGGLTTAGTRLP